MIQLVGHIGIANTLLIMPDSNSEPEKYSIDDMLDRLKNRDNTGSEGEIVTRADGTKALKVKKRKRRTDQSRDKLKAHNQRVQLIQIAGFIVFLVAMSIFGGIMIIYANSSVFRDGLVSKVENATGSDAKINEFRMNPAYAYAAHTEMSWPHGYVLHRFVGSSLKAKISPISFVGRVFEGDEIDAGKGNLFLMAPVSLNDSDTKTSGTIASLVKFNRYSVANLNVFFSPEADWEQMIENTEISYFPTKAKRGGEIRLNQGLLKMKGWPSLALDRSYMHFREGQLDIKSLRFQIPIVENQRVQDKGSIELSGVINPSDLGATHSLRVNLESFQISHLLGSGLGRFFHGATITKHDENSNVLKFTPGSGPEALLKLNMSNAFDSQITLTQFKFMGQLAIALNDRWYELPSFADDVNLLMKRSGELVDLEGIQMEQRGRMALRGSISIKDMGGNISGKLEVGIPETIIAASQNRRLDAIFSPVIDGYRWVNLEMTGTSAAPIDNFKNLYQTVALTNQPEVKPVPKSNGVDSFESLIKPE